jgi:hypothetical protein
MSDQPRRDDWELRRKYNRYVMREGLRAGFDNLLSFEEFVYYEDLHVQWQVDDYYDRKYGLI